MPYKLTFKNEIIPGSSLKFAVRISQRFVEKNTGINLTIHHIQKLQFSWSAIIDDYSVVYVVTIMQCKINCSK